jgi:predicted Ser/Thr protein kinase
MFAVVLGTMEAKQICAECGNPIEAEALTGLCPVCMMQVGLGSVETNPAAPKQGETQPFTAPSVEDLAGLFPQLEIQALIGVGGMGAVYKAHQRDLDRAVALKILVPRSGSDPGFAERFMREARALARLNHPHIVAVYDFGHKDHLNYFVMEFVDGANLRQVQKAGELSPDQALAIIPQICEALQFAHNEGVVHRDIKPENVLLDQKGRVKIADFGLAKIVGKQAQNLTLTQEGHVMGTPHYMAPEQVEHPHEVDHRADIYSLGVVFYEMLTGELPLGKFAPPSRKVQVDVRLDEVVLKTLEKEPGLRYQQVSQVATEVQTISTTPQEKSSERPAQTDIIAEATRQLKGPAIGLIVTGLLEWILVPLGVLGAVVAKGFIPGFIEIVILLAVLPIAGFLIFAGLKIRHAESYAVGIIAAVLAMFVTPANTLGLLVGIWTLVVLRRKEVRAAFWLRAEKEPLAPDWPGARRRAFWITVVHGLSFVLVGGLLLFVIPKFMAVFEGMSRPLTSMTRGAFGLVDFLQSHGLWVLIALLLLDGAILLLLSAYGGRRACRRWSIIVIAALTILAGGAMAAVVLPFQRLVLKLDATAPVPAVLPAVALETEAQYPFIAQLPQGSIELLGICEHPSKGKDWWAPDGSPAQEGPFHTRGSHSRVHEGQQAREFVIRELDFPADASSTTWKVESALGFTGGGVVSDDGLDRHDLRMLSVTLPNDLQSTNLRIGVGLDEWLTLGRSGGGSGMRSTSRGGQVLSFSFLDAVQVGSYIQITVVHTINEDWQIRTVAMTDAGEQVSGPSKGMLSTGMSHLTTTFTHLSLDNIKDFAFQVRPYHWVEFRNVSLVAGRKTAAQIRHAAAVPVTPSKTTRPSRPEKEEQRTALALSLTWGPVKEITLNDIDEAETGNYLDLDEGMIWGNAGVNDAEQALDLIRKHGIDLLCGHTKTDWDLITPDQGGLELALLEANAWDTLSLDAVEASIAQNPFVALPQFNEEVFRVYPLLPSQSDPMTLAFRTAETKLGLLQILDRQTDPACLRIRYKLVEGMSPEASRPVKTSTSP